ncbi:MAG: SDR family NAD(P)-dependent oxidoreductase [Myxococcota bacterium]
MSRVGSETLPTDAIAIVGMAGRFPGAANVAELWSLVREGRRGIRSLEEAELRAAGVTPAQLEDPRYVRARGVLEDVAGFDADLFGMSPREAAFTDPQHRIFLECALDALEDAAIDPSRGDRRIGVFGGVSSSSYFLNQVLAGTDARNASSELMDHLRLGSLGSEKDFFATRVSYRLDLRGPSVDVQSACSTSAVAVHLAVQSLLMHGCDAALAGGASVFVPHTAGYLAQAGGVLSDDGTCRPFEAAASGTVPGSGAGVLVLRRLEDALADGDPVRAVILGTGLNNDGALKVGFGAPGVDGQADAIAEALSVAGVSADSIGYVETHGTGTRLGDPIEIAALKSAFGAAAGEGDASAPCALGGVKANLGHLDAAAGIAGIAKAVLALEHRTIPPQPSFDAINPEIDFAGRFFVPSEATPWTSGPTPRRAGVSSFGIGGTNVHLVLQEAPAPEAPRDASAPVSPELLILSAHSAEALSARGGAVADLLDAPVEAAQEASGARLEDVAHTLLHGRRAMEKRQAIVASSAKDAADRLRTPGALAPVSPIRRVVFLLPGQGAQRVGMARGLLRADSKLRDHLQALCARLAPGLGFDPWPLYTGEGRVEIDGTDARERIDETWVAQPLLVALEVALGRRWLELGVEPAALLGHSLGELAAACLAGVFSEEDGLDLVLARGAILRAQPRGSMLAVRAAAGALEARLSDGPTGVVVAARNAPGATTLAGPSDAIEALARDLATEGISTKPLATSHAFHSPLVDGAVEPFVERVASIALHPPRWPVISNRSGARLTDAEATDPAYWGQQLRSPVAFAEGVASVGPDDSTAFLEVGPPGTLAPLVREVAPGAPRIACLAPPERRDGEDNADARAFLGAAGRLWAGGADLDLARLSTGSPSRRLGGLPGYPFQRSPHWVERPAEGAPAAAPAPDTATPAGRIWVPSWRRRPAAITRSAAGDWLLVARDEDAPIVRSLAKALAQKGGRVAIVQPGATPADWLAGLDRRDGPVRVVHLVGAATAPGDGADAVSAARDGFACVATLAAGLTTVSDREAPEASAPSELFVVSTGLADVRDDDAIDPGRATLLGPVRVAAQELPGLRVRLVDIASTDAERDAERLLAELLRESEDDVVALRGAHRWVEHVEALDLADAPRIGAGSLIVLLGGLGRMGRAMAKWLVRERNARVVLASRSAPDAHDADALEPELSEWCAVGSAEVHRVDVTDPKDLGRFLDDVATRLGAIDLIFHLANEPARTPLDRSDAESLLFPLTTKVGGALALERALEGHAPVVVVLSSSLASLLGGPGTASYTAANAFLDAFAGARRGVWRSVSWDVWNDPGAPLANLQAGLDVADAMEQLERILAAAELPHAFVSARDLAQRRQEVAERLRADHFAAREGSTDHLERAPRPPIGTPYVAARNELEQALAEIWAEVLGLETVGVDDPFFDLGGDSLLATMLLSKVTERFAIEIPVDRFFEAPTVAEAAVVLAEQLEGEASEDELDALLAEMEDLSDADAARLLEQEDAS